MNSKFGMHILVWLMIVLLAVPVTTLGQQAATPSVFKQEELDQILAPIALYPDALISQILIASTYPLEVVEADRFAKQNTTLKGDALTKALEAETWDPSVKSLVNFPQVLTMMSDKLDWTQKLGDAFLAQEKAVMDTVQSLRAKAQAAGNLKTTKEQKVIVQEKDIVIEPANPQVVYVPTYNPTVVYGAWPYPAYPPYYFYPPGYVAATSAFAFASGVALGAAWGYAWGSCNWHGGNIKYNYNQNININNNINRNWHGSQSSANAQGNWQHNAEHRKGVPYRDQATAERFNRAGTPQGAQSREAFSGRAEQVRQELGQAGSGSRGGAGDRARIVDRGAAGDRGGGNRGGASRLGEGGAGRGGFESRGGAFEGIDRGGGFARSASQRGGFSWGGGGRRFVGGGRGWGRRR
jgi:hypothetical protein